MSLPARALSIANCDPVSCIPSPESPANRMTVSSRTSRIRLTPAEGVVTTPPPEPFASLAPRFRELLMVGDTTFSENGSWSRLY